MPAVDAHYKKLSDKFRYTIYPPEVLINQVGYQHLFADQNDEAIAVFKLQVERYPESPNVYDSLGEAYEKMDGWIWPLHFTKKRRRSENRSMIRTRTCSTQTTSGPATS